MRCIAVAVILAAQISVASTAVADDQDIQALKNTDIFELEYASDPQISPDGASIAYVRRSNDIMTDRTRSNIWIASADGADHRPLLSGKASFSSPRWSPAGDRLAYISAIEGGKPQLFVRWMDTGQTALLTNLTQSPGSIAWSPDGRTIAFSMNVDAETKGLASPPAKPEGAEWAMPAKVIEQISYRFDGAGYLDPAYTHLFTVPADGGTPRQLTEGAFDHGGAFSWTPDSSAIIFSANRNEDWERDPLESDIWQVSITDKELTQLTDRKGPDITPTVSPDGAMIAYRGFDDEKMGYHTTHLYVMNADGSNIRNLTDGLDRSINAAAWAGNGSLILQYDQLGRTYLARLDVNGAMTPLVRDVGGTTLGRPYTSGGFSVNASGDIAYTSGRSSRPADLAVRPADGGAIRITRLNDDLFQDKTLANVERITWSSSADGREIEGWVAYPPDFDETRQYPLILEIHGGPFAAYGPQFSSEVQLYAAAGYVVLYANPRGSTSYGEEFANLIHHAYPGEDYNDLISGVDAVIEQGFINEEELFVTGGSGGGVLTAWIVGKIDRFKAAVVAKPVINWTSFTLTADAYPFFYQYWFDNPPWEDPETYWARSPLSLVGNVTTPTMLLTGEADYRTPISETEQYYQALQLLEVDTAMVRIPGASHGIAARPSHLIAKVDNILAWFERYRVAEEPETTDAASDADE